MKVTSNKLSFNYDDYTFPEDWEQFELGELLEVVERPIDMIDQHEYNLITVKRNFGGIESRGTLKGKEILVKTQFKIQENDFVISKRQIVHGACAIVSKEFGGAIVSNEYDVMKCRDKLLELFLESYVKLPFMKKYFYIASDGVHIEKLRFKTDAWLRNKICIPSTKEQWKISSIIKTCDKAIKLKEQLIDLKVRQKKWLMQNLLNPLSGIRLPGFKGGWIRTKICRITKVLSGATPSTTVSEYWGGDIPWMSSGELNNKHIHNVVGRITKSGLNNSGTKLIPISSVLIGLAGQGKTRGTVAINHIELCTNQSIASILPSDKHVSEYLYHNLDNRYDELRKLSSGDKQRGGLNLELINNIELQMPTIEEQTAIAEVLSTADWEISLLGQELAQWQAKKKALMQLLLTGLVRVDG